MRPGRYVMGIDLGTTNSLCALWSEGDPSPHIVPISQPTTDLTVFEARSPLPSAVLLRPGAVFVGEFPKYQARLGSRDATVVTSVKREMGTPWVLRHAGRSWTPEQISACILRAVREGLPLPPDAPPPERVVITVPACFGTEQRRATLRAARLAGFDPTRTDLFDEPTAALLHHTRSVLRGTSWPEPRRLMVLDVGGGTLDVSCLTLHQKGSVLVADVMGRSRFNELAGDDFDLNLAGLLLERFLQQRKQTLGHFDEPQILQLCAGLVYHAEKAKVRLCDLAVNCPEADQGKLETPIEVMDNTPLFWRTRVTMGDLAAALRPFFIQPGTAEARLAGFTFYTAIEECIASLRSLKTPDPDRAPDFVFLAGGSAQLPFLKQVVRNHFQAATGRAVIPQLVDQPMSAVALGAAWYAGAKAGLSGAGEVELIQRMHEGIYLMTGAGRPLQLVDPAAELPVAEARAPYDFEIGTGEQLEIDLVAGTGPDDVRMRPLDRRVVPLSGFVSRGDPIRLLVSVDDNRVCKVRCEATVNGAIVNGEMEFHNGYEWRRERESDPALPPVNPSAKGGHP